MKNLLILAMLTIFIFACKDEGAAGPQQELISFEYIIDGGAFPEVPSPRIFLSENSGTMYLNFEHFKNELNENNVEPFYQDTTLILDNSSRDSLYNIVKSKISLTDFSENKVYGYNEELAYQKREILVLNTNSETIMISSYEGNGPNVLLEVNLVLKKYIKDSYIKVFKED